MKKTEKGGDKKIKNKKKILACIWMLFILIILLFMNITYAKYITVEKTSSSTDIAAPIFIVESNEKININNTNNIGYYEFLVRNFNETSISEINFLYTIEIISNIDDRIQFELYNEQNIIPLENLKTKQLLLVGKEKVEQKYTLKIVYDNGQEESGEELFGEVQIRICSEQEKI